MSNTQRVLCSAVFIALLSTHSYASASTAQRRGGGDSGAAAVVRSFYRYHFTHNKCCFDEDGLRRRRGWFAPEIYRLMLREVRKETPPDIVPYFNGDPFTNSQDNPSDFSVGQASVRGGRASVGVTVRWTEGKTVVERRTYRVELRKLRGGWKIADIFYHDGTHLLGDLKRAG